MPSATAWEHHCCRIVGYSELIVGPSGQVLVSRATGHAGTATRFTGNCLGC